MTKNDRSNLTFETYCEILAWPESDLKQMSETPCRAKNIVEKKGNQDTIGLFALNCVCCMISSHQAFTVILSYSFFGTKPYTCNRFHHSFTSWWEICSGFIIQIQIITQS